MHFAWPTWLSILNNSPGTFHPFLLDRITEEAAQQKADIQTTTGINVDNILHMIVRNLTVLPWDYAIAPK
jgi:hypothetical protein